MLLILREEIICFIILAFLAFYYANTKIKEKGQSFVGVIANALCYVAFDAITVITIHNQEYFGIWNDLAHYGFYLFGVLLGFAFYTYCVNMQYVSIRRIKHHRWGCIPLIIYLVSAICLRPEYAQCCQGIWYSWGPLAFIVYAIFVWYCICGMAILVYHHKKLDARVVNAIYPMMGALAASIIVQIFHPELLMTGASATFMCLGIFIAMDNPDKKYREQALWDFLTGLRNRNSYERDVAKYSSYHGHMGVLVADLNNLKAINDHCGHEEGDAFIRTAAEILQKNLDSATSIYRVGGDEFIAFFINPDDKKIEREIDLVLRSCALVTHFQYPLEIAIGYHSNTQTIHDIIQAADHKMYEHKAALKSKS